MAENSRILVVGSINMDLVVRCSVFPRPGQTVLGKDLVCSPGGKGANQAVASSRLGAECAMVGRVGDDDFGTRLLTGLRAEGVNCDQVRRTSKVSTGAAIITVDGQGENAIVVASGANWWVTPDDVFAQGELFDWADVVLLQLELPLPTVRAAIGQARRHGTEVILDPAPATEHLCDELCEVDILSPNVSEAEILTGRKAGEERVDKIVAMELIARGAKAAVLKLGSRGSMVVSGDGHIHRIPPYRTEVVDTTAAGDAFTAALAVGVAGGEALRQAAQFANAAGALACSRLGAQSAMPTANEVRMLMADHPPTA